MKAKPELHFIPWLLPPSELRIAPGEVHVWQFSQDQPAQDLLEYFAWLDAEEQTRAAAYRFELDRQRFIARHGLLRLILSRYLAFQPADLVFGSTGFGKPFLPGGHPGSTPTAALNFNLSQSGSLALAAVTLDRRVGVDVEVFRRDIPYDQVVGQFFSQAEKAQWERVAEADKMVVFYQTWTRKEAFLKACGGGLSVPLDSFDVSLSPEEPARLLAVGGRIPSAPTEAGRWTMQHLQPTADSVAAVVVEGRWLEFRLGRIP